MSYQKNNLQRANDLNHEEEIHAPSILHRHTGVVMSETQTESQFWMYLNVIENHPEHLYDMPLTSLTGIFEGRPAVMVGADWDESSLETVFVDLKKYRKGLVLIASEAAAPLLLKQGLAPDLIALSHLPPDRVWTDLSVSEFQDTPLVSTSAVSPRILRSYLGSKIRVDWDFSFDALFAKVPPNFSLADVAIAPHLCYVTLKTLGCSTVGYFGFKDLDLNGFKEIIHKRPGLVWDVQTGLSLNADPAVLQSFSKTVQDIVDKSVLIRKVRAKGADSHALRQTAQGLLVEWRRQLQRLQLESLKTLREMSEMRRDHHPALSPGHERLYSVFFDRLEKELMRLTSHSSDVFDGIFAKLLGNGYFRLRSDGLKLKASDAEFAAKTLDLLDIYENIFTLIQACAAKCLEAIEYHNHHRWRYW